MLRVALFIDGSNMFYTEKTLGWQIDFRKLYDYFTKDFAMYNSFYYASEPLAEDDETQKKYHEFMLHGYTMRLKKLKEIRDSNGKIVAKKANLDIEMVVDMFNTKDNYDLLVLLSGDSDFVRAVDLLRTHGKQIFVFSTKGHSSSELINAADKFFDLSNFKQQFELTSAKSRENSSQKSSGGSQKSSGRRKKKR